MSSAIGLHSVFSNALVTSWIKTENVALLLRRYAVKHFRVVNKILLNLLDATPNDVIYVQVLR